MNDAPGLERRKWTIVGVLGLVFAGVLWSQFATDPSGSQDAAPARRKLPELSPAGTKAVARQWPRSEFAEIVRHNPFSALRKPEPLPAVPVASPEPPPDPAAVAADALTAFQSQRVRAVIMTDSGPVALLGNTMVREGDVIDGVRIVSISVDGLVVEPDDH